MDLEALQQTTRGLLPEVLGVRFTKAEPDLVEAELFLPWAAQNLRGEIFATCKVLEERADGEGALMLVRGAPADVKRLRELFGRK